LGVTDRHRERCCFQQYFITSASPGSTVATTLTLSAAGNVPETLALHADVPGGLSFSGLPGTVSLAEGETQSATLSLTVDAVAAINQ
jgi:hypothetical protein